VSYFFYLIIICIIEIILVTIECVDTLECTASHKKSYQEIRNFRVAEVW